MSERVEQIMKEYPRMKRECACIFLQIQNFHGISEQDMIDSMYYGHPTGEKVPTTQISDKTPRIALAYGDKIKRANEGWLGFLEGQYLSLSRDLDFFEAAVQSLSGELPNFISDMVMGQLTWDDLSVKYHISRTAIAKRRKKAIEELDHLYGIHDQDLTAYLLS